MENNVENKLTFGKEIGQKYKLIEKIGEGSFGVVYKGITIKNNELVAIKLEDISNKAKIIHNEAKILKYLSGVNYVPKLKWYGTFDNYRYIVIPLLGKSLMDYKEILKTLQMKTCLILLKKLINIIKDIHNKGILYRDIKPENFLVDINNTNNLYIIDFGLAKPYLDSNNEHVKINNNHQCTGTIRYSSIHIHQGYNHSRRDDLISIVYMIQYLFFGKLPWSGLKIDNMKEKYAKIKEIKQNEFNKINDSLELNDPIDSVDSVDSTDSTIINIILKYCYNLKFNECPKYNTLISLINKHLINKFNTKHEELEWNI